MAMPEFLATIPAALGLALAAVWAILGIATAAVLVVVRRGGPNAAELAARTRTWWWIVALVSVALLAGPTATAILFAVASFLSLREYLSIVPVRRVDRMAILLAYLAIPVQYLFVDRRGRRPLIRTGRCRKRFKPTSRRWPPRRCRPGSPTESDRSAQLARRATKA
jgi:hypothetical protein